MRLPPLLQFTLLACCAFFVACSSPAPAPSSAPVLAPKRPTIVSQSSKFTVDAAKAELARAGVTRLVFAERTQASDGHWYANFGYFILGPDKPLVGLRGRLCILDLQTNRVQILIKDQDGTLRDPCVSYDGKKILFSWRKSGAGQFHLYEINADGTGIRQLTSGIYDDIEPCYLPDGGIIFVSSRARRWVNCWITPVATIHRCNADGSGIQILSPNVEQDNTPWVLSDGRILYTRWEYVDRSQLRFHHLWTMNPDGTGQKVFFGNMHNWNVYVDAKPIPGSDKILFSNSPKHGKAEHAGDLATVTAANGPDDKSAIKTIRSGDYRDPYPIAAGIYLAAKGNSLVCVTAAGNEVELYAGKVMFHEPRPLVPRPREPVVASATDWTKKTGTLALDNAYLGRNMAGVNPGDIKKLLILESLPKPVNYGGGTHDCIPLSWHGSFTLERLLGTVPVETDGSASFIVPALRPLILVALDDQNRSVKRMQSFLTVMPGERLSCIGCHENRTTAPGSPTRRIAFNRPPSTIAPVPGVPAIFACPRDIQPILDRNCIKCHASDKLAGNVDLSGDRGAVFSLSYLNLVFRNQIADGQNDTGNIAPRKIGDSASPLMDKLTGGHHGVQASEAEIQMARHWINVGAPYPGTYAALGTGMVRYRHDNSPRQLTVKFAQQKPVDAAFKRRCAACHQKLDPLTKVWSDNWSSERQKAGDHPFLSGLAYNLSHPEHSKVLLKPLAKSAGGLGMLKKNPVGKEEIIAVFKDTNDPDYRAILALAQAGQKYLETENPRFDMPGFKPSPEYIREMKRFGILPETFDLAKDSVNPYETDRRYWESLWYYPPGEAPKLHANPMLNQLLLQYGVKRHWEADFTKEANR